VSLLTALTLWFVGCVDEGVEGVAASEFTSQALQKGASWSCHARAWALEPQARVCGRGL
jgi:hypothetical protein